MTGSPDRRVPEHFAAYTELEDAANSSRNSLDGPCEDLAGSAVIEIAKILTRFDDRIDDEWRANLIKLGGNLLRLQRAVSALPVKE